MVILKWMLQIILITVFQIDKDQAELARANFSILKKEAQGILDMVCTVKGLSLIYFFNQLQFHKCSRYGVYI